MLASRYRISRKDWDRYLVSARSFRFEHITVKTQQSESLHSGVVISKKILRLSTGRHSVRRIIYGWIDTNRSKIGNRVFVVFITKNAQPEMYIRELQQAVDALPL